MLADRRYFSGEEILACDQAGIAVTVPKPLTSGAKAEGRFGKQDFVYETEADAYQCPAGEQLSYRYTNVDGGLTLRRYWTAGCHGCALKARCTPAKERRVARWEHEAVLEAVQRRLDADPHTTRHWTFKNDDDPRVAHSSDREGGGAALWVPRSGRAVAGSRSIASPLPA